MTGLRRDRMPLTAAPSGAAIIYACTCGESIRLALQYDSKTSPIVSLTRSGSGVLAKAGAPNAWALPAGPLDVGGSCPGSTAACIDCYGAGMEGRYSNVSRLVSANLAGVRHVYACGGRAAVVEVLTRLVNHSATVQLAAGIVRPSFRWHSDGDIFAAWYARAIREVALATPGVDQWIYTRSLGYVRDLMPAPDNLRVIVSVDRYNVTRAAKVAARYGLPVSILAGDKAESVDIWGRADKVAGGAIPAAVLCPVVGAYQDGRKMPAHVVGIDGRRSSLAVGAPAVGACIACGLCLPGGANKSVTFLVHGGRAKAGTPGRLGAAVAVRVRRGDIIATT